MNEGEDKIRNMDTRLSRGTRTKDKERTEDRRLNSETIGFSWNLLLRRTKQWTRRGRRKRIGEGRYSHPLGLTLKEDEAADKESPEDKRRIREILASLGTYS
jgi:hypothetical protein